MVAMPSERRDQNMKIGIVTFHGASNYGAVLQAFALQTFLKQAGHSPFFIDHHHGIMPHGIRKYVGRSPGDTLARWAACRRRSVFADFRRQYFDLSEKTYLSEQALTENSPVADAYICGSDQIWNPNYLKLPKDERAFWLDFGNKKIRRIAYAVSLGVSSLSPEWSRRFAYHLEHFDSVSVREKNAVPILAELGRSDTAWVPDPTLLLTADDYERGLDLIEVSEELVFSYTLGPSVPDVLRKTRECVCNSFALPLVEAYDRNSLRILLKGVLTPCRWLSLLKASRFVVTNSFHGLVFSLLFKRPFVVLPLQGTVAGMNGRIESLLAYVGLEDRLITHFDSHRITELCANPIEWDAVGKKIRAFSEIGSAFLTKALSAAEKCRASSRGSGCSWRKTL